MIRSGKPFSLNLSLCHLLLVNSHDEADSITSYGCRSASRLTHAVSPFEKRTRARPGMNPVVLMTRTLRLTRVRQQPLSAAHVSAFCSPMWSCAASALNNCERHLRKIVWLGHAADPLGRSAYTPTANSLDL